MSVTIARVIWLRTQIERGRQNPWVAPLIVVLLAVLLLFVAAHSTADHATSDGGANICVMLAFLAMLTLLVPRPRVIVFRGLTRGRAPPALDGLPVPVVAVARAYTPLRL